MRQSVIALPTVPPEGRLYTIGLFLVTTLLLTVAGPALMALGWQYAESGGNPLEKIHPATLVAFVVLAFSLLARANPLAPVFELLIQRPGLTFYLVAVLLMILHSIFVVERAFTIYIDTFLLPAVLYMLLCGLSEKRSKTLALTVHVLILANGILGLTEFALGFRTFPLIVEGIDVSEEWRSSALLGHPLAAAQMTGCYILMLVMGGARDLPVFMRSVAFVISALSMVVFGGRAATAFLLVMLALLGLRRAFRLLRGGTLDHRSVIAGLITLPIAALVIVGLMEYGFFDGFLSRIADDAGSASTRIEMFELLRHLTWTEFFLKPDPAVIGTWASILGLDYGIESFWLSMVLAHGFIAAAFFFIALYFFCREVITASGRGAISLFIYYFAVASTSLSLSAKTVGLAIFVMMVLLLLRRSGPVAAVVPARSYRVRRSQLQYAT